MGRTAVDHLSSAIAWDGKIDFRLETGEMSYTTASQVRQKGIVAPCNAQIVAALVKTLASATGASSQINIGRNGSASALMTYHAAGTNLAIPASAASGLYDLMSASTWVASASKCVNRGDHVYLNVKKSTAVGRFAVSLQFMPR